MGILDTVGGLIGGSPATSGLAAQVLALLNGSGNQEGLSRLVEQFRTAGLDDIISSWISTGANLPVSPDQLTNVLGRSKLTEMASGAGLPLDLVAGKLAEMLPGIVDALTPEGKLPPRP
jgi:uncharacterized protein YidB (DUF937 family)